MFNLDDVADSTRYRVTIQLGINVIISFLVNQRNINNNKYNYLSKINKLLLYIINNIILLM